MVGFLGWAPASTGGIGVQEEAIALLPAGWLARSPLRTPCLCVAHLIFLYATIGIQAVAFSPQTALISVHMSAADPYRASGAARPNDKASAKLRFPPGAQFASTLPCRAPFPEPRGC